jgi:opacity protein-like surface antigen
MEKLFIVSTVVLAGLFSSIHGQTYQLNGTVGFGYGRFITDMDLSGLNKNGYSGTIRVMWQPEHLLRVGLETGYYRLYSIAQNNIQTEFGPTDAQSSLDAYPLVLNWAMQIIHNLEIFAGIGTTFLKTSFKSFGVEVNSTQLSTSYIIGGTYTYDIADKIKLGGELKYYRINKIEDGTLTLQFMFVYKLFDW